MKHLRNCLFVSCIILISMAMISCQQPGSSLEDKNKDQTVQANDELLNKGNLAFADEIFTAEYRERGPEVIKEFVQKYRTAFPDLQVKVDPIIAEGNMTGWRRTLTGTFTNEFNGIQPTGKKISWQDIVLSRMTDDGKIAEEWGASDLADMIQNSNNIEGVFEYLPPMRGQSINRNGRYVYLYGPSDGSQPLISQSGVYSISNDTVTNVINYSTDKSLAGQSFKWTITSKSGDTLSYTTMNMEGEVTGTGSAIKVSD